jgi:hypothetical protein
MVHTGEYIIIGVYQTTAGRMPLWFKRGDQPPLPKEHWQVKENPLVITLGINKQGDKDGRASAKTRRDSTK